MIVPIQQKSMGRILLWSNLLSEPLFTLYGFIVFIMYKDLGASALQITLLTMLKPLVTLLSFYWSAGLRNRPANLKSNVLWAGLLMRAPFLFCYWIDSPWYMIGAAVNYMFFYRAAIPAWMEIIKRTMGPDHRGKAFSISSAFGYLEGVILALACGAMLDKDPGIWKILFPAAALIGLFVLIVQTKIAVSGTTPSNIMQNLALNSEKSDFGENPPPSQRQVLSDVEYMIEKEKKSFCRLKELLIRPWRDSYRLMRERLDFSRFQWGFMVSGFGLMLIQPALPLFMVDILGVSYLEMAGAVAIAKGLGFAISSPLWARLMEKVNVMKMASFVFVSIGLFTLLLGLSVWHVFWLYIAYFWYGIGQGGSHLVWNLSGPIFAKNEESSIYTGVNVAMAGLRGAVAPPLGGFLSVCFGPIQVLLIGGLLCFYSGIRILQSRFAKDPLSIKP